MTVKVGEILELPQRMMTYIEKLPASDRKTVIKLMDGLLARHKLNSQGTRR